MVDSLAMAAVEEDKEDEDSAGSVVVVVVVLARGEGLAMADGDEETAERDGSLAVSADMTCECVYVGVGGCVSGCVRLVGFCMDEMGTWLAEANEKTQRWLDDESFGSKKSKTTENKIGFEMNATEDQSQFSISPGS